MLPLDRFGLYGKENVSLAEIYAVVFFYFLNFTIQKSPINYFFVFYMIKSYFPINL